MLADKRVRDRCLAAYWNFRLPCFDNVNVPNLDTITVEMAKFYSRCLKERGGRASFLFARNLDELIEECHPEITRTS